LTSTATTVGVAPYSVRDIDNKASTVVIPIGFFVQDELAILSLRVRERRRVPSHVAIFRGLVSIGGNPHDKHVLTRRDVLEGLVQYLTVETPLDYIARRP
jgi:hypothetical protein